MFTCFAHIIEPLGFEREIDVYVGSQHIKAKMDLRTTAGEGDSINLCFDMDRVHLFDPATGRNLMCDAAFNKGC
jgi:hypothetical protein